MARVLSFLVAAAVSLQLASAFDEIGFAQASGAENGTCTGLQSTFVRTGNNVTFDVGQGMYDAASQSVKLTFVDEERESGTLVAANGALNYTIKFKTGASCSYPLVVLVGTFLGVAGTTAKADNAGVVKPSFNEAKSDASFNCLKNSTSVIPFVTVGQFAAAGGRVGTYDEATKKATFITAFDRIYTVSVGDDKKVKAEFHGNTGKTSCHYDLQVVDGTVLGVAPSARRLRNL